MNKTFAGYISLLQRDFLDYTKDELKEIGLNYGQLPFILYVGKHENCTQSELTERLKVDWGYSQRTITKLCEEGFLIKSTKENGGRNNYLSLTAKGQAAFKISHDVFFTWDKKTLGSLSDNERQLLLDLFDKIINAQLHDHCHAIKK